MALLALASGAWIGQAVHVAARLGIADLLGDGPKPPAALAAATGTDATALYRLLRALASLGVFAEDAGGRFTLTPLAEGLRSDAPGSLRGYAIMMGEEWHWRAWGELLESVRTGGSAFERVHGCELFRYFAEHPEAARVFNAAMTSRTGQETAAVTGAYDWPAGTIVDVGGGQGALLTAILARRPEARGILFDLPHVIDAARRPIEEKGLAARCELVGGDFFDRVPAGGDLYLIKRVLHDWDDGRAAAILRCCRAAMAADARLLVIEHVLPPGNAPSWGKLLDLQMLVLTPGGQERDEAGFHGLLATAGFRLERVLPAGPTASLIEALPV
ncbi:MAG TPA: methyltransferase [Geminicoccaceae bacterium]|nr:methyltransferase [Geminicoccaceae bacterium]